MGKLIPSTPIQGTYNTIQPGPFDSRQAVVSYADLTSANTWKVNMTGGPYYPVYKGMLATVQGAEGVDPKLYVLKSFTQVGEDPTLVPPTNMVWEEISTVGPTGPKGDQGIQGI